MSTISRMVTFPAPFTVPGIDAPQPAGTYVVETDEALIENVSFQAYRRTSTRIQLAADPARPGVVETVNIDPIAIEAVLVAARAR